MNNARNVAPDIDILPSYFPIPGFGTLPVNAYVLKAQQPVLIDTGLHMDTDAFVGALESTIDPSELQWLYLTHPNQDHVGSLVRLLDRVPQMRLITTFLGYGILSLFTQIGLDRVYLLNPGESLDVGDRTLTALKPPTFDNPATTGAVRQQDARPVQLRQLRRTAAVRVRRRPRYRQRGADSGPGRMDHGRLPLAAQGRRIEVRRRAKRDP